MTAGAGSIRWSKAMTPRLCGAEYLREYKILVTFEDGKTGVVDLRHELWGEVFEPLRDVGLFRRFRFDPELDTIVWPTGADLAPEYLYENAAGGAGGADAEPAEDSPFFPVSKVRVSASDTGHRRTRRSGTLKAVSPRPSHAGGSTSPRAGPSWRG